MAYLSERELSTYRESGYVLMRQLVDSETLESARAFVTNLVNQRAQKLVEEGKIKSTYEEEPFKRRLARIHEESEIASGLWDLTQVFDDPKLYSIVRHPDVLDVIESLIGSEIGWTSSYVTRPKLRQKRLGDFPWHQDSQYYGASTRHLHIVSVWIPLVEVDERNGCLSMLPGSHNWGLLEGERDGDNIFRTFEDVEKRNIQPVSFPMTPGDALFFTNLTYHMSSLNHTDTVRWAVDLRYVSPPDSRELSEEEREGYERLDKHYRTLPALVRSRQPEKVASDKQLQQWLTRRNERSRKD